MVEKFKSYLKAHGAFTDEDVERILRHAIRKNIRRRQFLLHEGETARYKCFIITGLLRLYRIRDDGSEHILKFAAENWWINDMESYNSQKPSKGNIDALEDTEVILWAKENFEELLKTMPVFKAFCDQIIAKSYDATQNRLFSNIGLNAHEKYNEFINNYPDIFNRLSLQMVASYLGISRETLSRIRNTKAHKAEALVIKS